MTTTFDYGDICTLTANILNYKKLKGTTYKVFLKLGSEVEVISCSSTTAIVTFCKQSFSIRIENLVLKTKKTR